jgi:nicotinamide-nucleotide amidase
MNISSLTTKKIAALLIEAKQSIGVAESSTGGLISASLLAIPGASAYFNGGAIIYTMRARRKLLQIDKEKLNAQTPLTDDYVTLCAEQIKKQLKSTWGLAELGATGPAGTPYGHPPGICVLAVVGPKTVTRRIETCKADREQNMIIFRDEALSMLLEALA